MTYTRVDLYGTYFKDNHVYEQVFREDLFIDVSGVMPIVAIPMKIRKHFVALAIAILQNFRNITQPFL